MNSTAATEEDESACDVCGDTQLLSGSRCEECDGTGWVLVNSCTEPEIERCDACRKFATDLEAAKAYLTSPGCRHWLDRIVLKCRKKSEIRK